MGILVVVKFCLVLGTTNSPPTDVMLAEIVIMGGFRHLVMSAQSPQSNYLGVGFIQIILQVIIQLVLVMVMVKVVWFLGPTILFPKKLIVVLVVVIFLSKSR